MNKITDLFKNKIFVVLVWAYMVGLVALGKITNVWPLKDAALTFAVLFCLWLSAHFLIQNKHQNLAWCMAAPSMAIIAQLFQALATDRAVFLYNTPHRRIWCLVIWLTVAILLLSLIRRVFIAGLVNFIIGFFFCVLNIALMQFRNQAFFWCDIFSFGTAMDVAGAYHITVTPELIFAALVFVWSVMFLCAFPVKKPRGILPSFAGLVIAIVWGAVMYMTPIIENTGLDGAYRFRNNRAFALALLLQSQDSVPSKKPNYDEYYDRITEEYKSDPVSLAANDKADVIVIMNESFTDLRKIGAKFDEDPYTLWDEIAKESISGSLHSSVYGGSTANSEYEFLTGDTVAYFESQLLVVYQLGLRQPTQSLATYFHDLGYDTLGMHPGRTAAWNRDVAYPRLGFDNKAFLEDFSSEEYIRSFTSDARNYDEVLLKLNEMQDRPAFIFNVTIQNHGSYDDENFPSTVHITNTSVDYPLADQYASLAKISCEAFYDLLQQLKQRERKTYVVFYGDHQPMLPDEFLMELTGSSYSGASGKDREQFYQVPFIIWCNQGIEPETVEDHSINWLQLKLLEVLGLPRTGYQKFLSDVYEQYPIISNQALVSTDGSFTSSHAEGVLEQGILKDYMAAIYFHLHQNQDPHPEFFRLAQ